MVVSFAKITNFAAQKTIQHSRPLPTLPNGLRKVEGGPGMEIRTREARKKRYEKIIILMSVFNSEHDCDDGTIVCL